MLKQQTAGREQIDCNLVVPRLRVQLLQSHILKEGKLLLHSRTRTMHIRQFWPLTRLQGESIQMASVC